MCEDVNAAEFQAYTREVIGRRDDGSLILGDREPLDDGDDS